MKKSLPLKSCLAFGHALMFICFFAMQEFNLHSEERPIQASMIRLVTSSEAKKIDDSTMKVQGRLKDSDKVEIFALYGRVVGVGYKPLLLVIEWDDFSFACRISTSREEIVFVKVEGNWVVSTVMTKVP